MKKSTLIILAIALFIALFFYGNMYRNGTFSKVNIIQKSIATHTMQGVWIAGSFSKQPDEDSFFAMQQSIIEQLKQDTISVFYAINPTKENHQQFKAFMGIECAKSQKLLVDSFKIVEIRLQNVCIGSQNASPNFQRVHTELMNYAEEKNQSLKQNSIFEQFTQTSFRAEMELTEKK